MLNIQREMYVLKVQIMTTIKRFSNIVYHRLRWHGQTDLSGFIRVDNTLNKSTSKHFDKSDNYY